MSHYKPYPVYRESGVEWIGRMPDRWQVRRMTSLFREAIRIGDSSLPILSISIHDGITDDELAPEDRDRQVYQIQDRTKYKRVAPNDLAYNMMRAWQGAFGTVAVDGLVSPAYVVAEPIDAFHTGYIEHLLRTSMAIEEMRRYSRGIADFRMRLYWDYFRDLKVCLPPLDEQDAILNRISRETARIDALITKKTRFIELLKEKRHALITHAVTKGLDPDVPMRDSGVEWIGEVPEHWSVQPIKYLVNIGNGSTPSKENGTYWENGTFPWLTSSCVNLELIESAEQFVTDTALRECHLPIITPPAVLVGITGQGKTRGMASTLTIEATINQHIAFLKPTSKSIRIELLREFLNAAYEWLRFDSEGVGSTKGAITCEQLGNTKIALPPLSEQEEILDLIGRQTDRLDRLTSKTQRSIDLLKERRAALITAAVTGQIDLRESA